MSKRSIHCYISGKVQNVFYRAQTQKMANQFELTGWVRNLDDGRVEVEAHGNEDSIAKLIDWLKKGPPSAKVTHVEVAEIEEQDIGTFEVR